MIHHRTELPTLLNYFINQKFTDNTTQFPLVGRGLNDC